MTRDEAQKAIRRIAVGPSENVFLSQHGKVRNPGKGKRPLSKPEMMEVLKHGWIVEGPAEDNALTDGWKVSVHRNADEHRQEVVGVLRPEDRMFVITGYEDIPVRRRRPPSTREDTE